jgi:hypothetical protein
MPTFRLPWLTLAVWKRRELSSARNNWTAGAGLANHWCGGRARYESILRPKRPRESFYTAKTHYGLVLPTRLTRTPAPS